MSVKTTSIRVDEKTLRRLDRLAQAMDRPRSWVLGQAIEHYLDYEEWFVREVERGIAEADRGHLVSHEEVMSELRRRVRKPAR
jgi:predicted transcriptional regulator